MSKLTVESYEELIRRSGLVEPGRLDRILEEIRTQFGEKSYDSEFLAERLVEARLITLWQNQMLMEGRQDVLLGGRHKGFFLGSYKLLSHLGTGGMNSVYLAEHTVMKRLVAIKVLPFNGDDDRAFLERFRLESRAIAALDHPNIVRAHDFNCDGSIYYLVMEYVEGKDLHHFVKERGPLPFNMAADFVRQAAEGLAHAHKASLIHRDVKPANLLVDRKKVVKILDLGVARLDVEDDDECSISRDSSQNILGTADYLAPEQALDSHNVDARADIYSLGCTLYFLLTGHPPFPKGTLAQRMLAHQMQEPPSIFEDRPNAPAGLVEICQRMMAKKPQDRFCSMEEVSAAVAEWTQTYQREAEEEQLAGKGGLANSDTFSGLGPGTTLGARKKQKPKAKVPGDERISCRTCGTEFGRYMYRSKCPKCGTVNHPAASGALFSVSDFGSSTTNMTAQTSTPAEAHPDPDVKASCPSCGATFNARWAKCLVCGAATVMHGPHPQNNTTLQEPTENLTLPDEQGPPPDDNQFGPDLQAPEEYSRLQAEASGSSVAGERSVARERSVASERSLAGRSVSLDGSAASMAGRSSSLRRHQQAQAEAEAARKAELDARRRRLLVNGLVLALTLGLAGLLGFMALSTDVVVERYPSGQKKAEGRLEDGQRQGVWHGWFENGQKQYEGEYVDGRKHGLWTYWNEHGQQISRGNFHANEQDGQWVFRYPDGQLQSRGRYERGQQEGVWTFWHSAGHSGRPLPEWPADRHLASLGCPRPIARPLPRRRSPRTRQHHRPR